MRVVELTYPTGAKCAMKPGEAIGVLKNELSEHCDLHEGQIEPVLLDLIKVALEAVAQGVAELVLVHDFYSGEQSRYSVRVFDMPDHEFQALPEFEGP